MSLSVRSPFPDHCWPRVWQWIQPFRHRVCDDYSPATVEEFVSMQMARSHHAQTWGVWRGEELGGLILVEPVNPVLCQSHVLFKREFWGRATTEAAIRQVYETVFHSGVQKIASFVFSNNHAILALAKSLGAREEGLLKNHTRRNGLPCDMIALGLIREEFLNHASGNTGSHVNQQSRGDWRVHRGGRAEQPQTDSDVHAAVDAAAAAHAGDSGQRPADRAAGPWQGLRAA